MGGAPSREEAPVSVPAVTRQESNIKPTTNNSIPAVVAKTNEEELKRSNSKTITEIPRAKEALEKPKRVPHMYQAIIKNADNLSTMNGSLLDQVQSSGIFLNNKKQKYWVEERTGHNCFMLFARGLQITWSENNSYWQWASLKESRDEDIEIASLLNVCWLDVHGKFETSYLTPKVMYEVVFVVMMEVGYGWAKPVNLRLKLPNRDSDQLQHAENLRQIPKGQWIELKVGEFMAEEKLAGEMEFTLFEYEGGQWKRGLIIKGAIIRPKKVT